MHRSQVARASAFIAVCVLVTAMRSLPPDDVFDEKKPFENALAMGTFR